MYYLVNPPIGTRTVSVTFDAGIYRCVGGAISLTGVDQTNPIDDDTGPPYGEGVAGGTGTTASVTVTTQTAGAWVIDTLIVRNPNGTTSVGANQTQRWNININGIHGAGSHEGPKTPAGDVTMSWSIASGSDGYSISAAPLKPASSNSSPNTPTITNYNTGAWTSDNTPALNFTQDDPDSGEQVKYQIQIDGTDNTFANLVVDYTSDFMAEGAASFTVGQAAGSGSYDTGSQGQTLSDGSYYWRVKSIDDDTAESGWSTANSGSIAFKVDATDPTAPGNLTESSKTSSSATLSFGSQSTETNFDTYKIFYKQAPAG